MTEIMTASDLEVMTDGQIENVVGKLRDALRKHRNEFRKGPVQEVLGVENLGMELLAPFRTCAEGFSQMIVRRVKVNRKRTPKEALAATGRMQYVDDDVVDAMPRGEEEEVEVCFFSLGRYVSDDDLDGELAKRGLTPADPYSVAAVNEDDLAFADQHPNGIHWKDVNGKWCYVAFFQWVDGGRSVDCGRDDSVWHGSWWIAGVRKVS